jgi:ribosome-associated toxin RatA of RatAB toxin-antitoxin module
MVYKDNIKKRNNTNYSRELLVSKLDLSLHLAASPEKLIELATDYEKLSSYLPRQLKNVRIIEKKNNETITQETLTFKTIIKNEIDQQTKHTIENNTLKSEILSGPAKGTCVNMTFDKDVEGTLVLVIVDLKLSFKAKFLQPLIKKVYKSMLIGVLYKMNNIVMGIK